MTYPARCLPLCFVLAFIQVSNGHLDHTTSDLGKCFFTQEYKNISKCIDKVNELHEKDKDINSWGSFSEPFKSCLRSALKQCKIEATSEKQLEITVIAYGIGHQYWPYIPGIDSSYTGPMDSASLKWFPETTDQLQKTLPDIDLTKCEPDFIEEWKTCYKTSKYSDPEAESLTTDAILNSNINLYFNDLKNFVMWQKECYLRVCDKSCPDQYEALKMNIVDDIVFLESFLSASIVSRVTTFLIASCLAIKFLFVDL